ncbi:hypothetical protein GF324_09070 [bacterium]|nr:hypothetical protein [bacterium]
MQRPVVLCVLLLAALLLVGCAAGPNPSEHSPDEAGKVAGFWKGLWHGFIIVITFIISLFSDSVTIYEVHNNGGWYNFGFFLGVGAALGGSGSGACRGTRKK